jgi:hypothetical protein
MENGFELCTQVLKARIIRIPVIQILALTFSFFKKGVQENGEKI